MVLKASSISKRRQFHGGRKDVCAREDIISRLPDEMLCHILSYLPTKEAVRTSSLSKRWNNIWASVPCIVIDEESLLSVDRTRYRSPEVHRCFMDFVDRVLRMNEVYSIRKFRLSCHNYRYDCSRLSEWINGLVMRDIEELDLGLSGNQFKFPHNIFTIKNLVILRLRNLGRIQLNVHTKVYLPSLKILHINSVLLSNDSSMKNVLDGCPIIEELDIGILVHDRVVALSVHSCSMKSLRVHHQHFVEGQLRIVLDAPNVELLDLEVDNIVRVDVINLSSLFNVKIDFCGYGRSKRVKLACGKRFFELMRKFSNTKYLVVSSKMMKCLEYAQWDDLPVVYNVTHLELFDYSWQVLPYLLECFPNLKTLVLHKQERQWRERHQQLQAPKGRP